MKNFIEVLEKIGQTQSVHQTNTISSICADVDCNDQSFKNLSKNTNDLVCMLFPDDDGDDAEEIR